MQAKRQFVIMHNSCCFSKTVDFTCSTKGRLQPRAFGWIECTLENIETIGTPKKYDQKLLTGVDKALSCLGDFLGPMSTLGDIRSNRCHFEMNLETAEDDLIKHLSHTWMIELYNWVTKPCLWLPCILSLLAMTKCSSYLLLAMWQLMVSNWRLVRHINLSLGRCPVELAQGPSRVALVRDSVFLEVLG